MINQINIIVESTDAVEGYSNIGINDINQITNGYINNIVFTTIDKVEQKDRDLIFVTLLKKLSHGGQIIIKFLNPFSLCQKMNNHNFNGANFISLVSGIKSSWTDIDFMTLLSSIPGYELIKHIHEDNYSIVTIEKSK